MRLFGKDITLRDKPCMRLPAPISENGYPVLSRTPFIDLYVKVTYNCNANCPFCCNDKMYYTSSYSFDADKLFYIIREIVGNGIRLNRISITGGEPSLCPDTVTDLLYRISRSNECAFTKVQLNTNGLNKNAQILMHHPRLNNISLSFHHYDRDKLTELYGFSVGSSPLAGMRKIINKLNISCNLIKGYIDSPSEIEKMICYAVDNGIKTVGFVSLMQTNRYCKERFLDFRKIDLSTVPSLTFLEERFLSNICGCRNYLFQVKKFPIAVYFRIKDDPLYCGSSLLYDGEYLRQGFHNDNIIF